MFKLSMGIDIKAASFKLSGRTAMLGAIQIFKQNRVFSWMDTILVPSKRRDVLLEQMQGKDDAEM
jgi:hypothetical protein